MKNLAIDKFNKEQIHVVILGAGASKQCLPNGDANGNKIPLMNEIHLLPDIKQLLEDNDFDIQELSFESFYSNLAKENSSNPFLKELNDKIYQYFEQLRLPEDPTLYDYLLLSLKEVDIIATFNWDPLLVQAYKRVQTITKKLPQVFFLHGTVSLGICQQHKIVNLKHMSCRVCSKNLSNIQLLYPTSEKDYETDEYIKDQWDALKHYLKIANGMTIFGYAAPQSDIAAIDLLKSGWGKNEERVMEEIQIIDLKDREELKSTWSEFIHETHYTTYSNYHDSPIAHFPRRISEAQFLRFNLNVWLDNHKIEPGLSFHELKLQLAELLKYES